MATNSRLNQNVFWKWEWRFLIQKTGASVFLGMCLESCAAKDKFKHDYFSYFGHGNYIINQNGYVYTHTNSNQVERANRIIKFQSGDTLKIQYDCNQRIMTMSLVDTEQIDNEIMTCRKYVLQIRLNVAPAPEGDCYRPCAHIIEGGTVIHLIMSK